MRLLAFPSSQITAEGSKIRAMGTREREGSQLPNNNHSKPGRVYGAHTGDRTLWTLFSEGVTKLVVELRKARDTKLCKVMEPLGDKCRAQSRS